MDITSRRKRPLDRTVPHLRDTRLVIIFSEGEKTEKQYFESDLFRSHRVQVKVIETDNGLSAPKHVFDRMKTYLSNVDLEPNDEYWLVTDVDRWPEEQLSEVFSHAIRGKNRAQLAISNPSFELWLYLHLGDWTGGSVNSAQIETALRVSLDGYNKSHLQIDTFRPGVRSAVERAKILASGAEQRWPANPGTHVYRVVESALAISSTIG